MPGILFTNWRQDTRSTGTRHILVMEQEPEVLAILCRLLSDEEYDVTLSCARPLWTDVVIMAPDVIIANPVLVSASPAGIYPAGIATTGTGLSIPIIYCTIDPDIAAVLGAAGRTTLLAPFDLDDALDTITDALPSLR